MRIGPGEQNREPGDHHRNDRRDIEEEQDDAVVILLTRDLRPLAGRTAADKSGRCTPEVWRPS
jgi:hypothetical protein